MKLRDLFRLLMSPEPLNRQTSERRSEVLREKSKRSREGKARRMSAPPQYSTVSPSEEKLLFVSPIKDFNERGVDVEGITAPPARTNKHSVTPPTSQRKHSTASSSSSSKLRAKKGQRGSRPSSVGNLHSLFRNSRGGGKDPVIDALTRIQIMDISSPVPNKESDVPIPPIPDGGIKGELRGERGSYVKRDKERESDPSSHYTTVIKSKKNDIPSTGTQEKKKETTFPVFPIYDSKERFRKDYVHGLWSISPFRLHISDAATNTASEDSGYTTLRGDKARGKRFITETQRTPQRCSPRTGRNVQSCDETLLSLDLPVDISLDDSPLPKGDVPLGAERMKRGEAGKEEEFNAYFQQSLDSSSVYSTPGIPLSPVSKDSSPLPSPSADVLRQLISPTIPPSLPPKLRKAKILREEVSTGSAYNTILPLAQVSPLNHRQEIIMSASTEDNPSDWMLDLAPTRAPEQPALPIPTKKKPSKGAVVAVDIGTSCSRYAFCINGDVGPDQILPRVHPMSRAESSTDMGSTSCYPTALLLCPDGRFHSFGYSAQESYHDMTSLEAQHHHYFENFKANVVLAGFQEPQLDSRIQAVNGNFWPAVDIFAHVLRFLKQRALLDLSDRMGGPLDVQDIRWVVNAPFFWGPEAKQFMREASYQAGMGSTTNPGALLIGEEPEVAGIACWRLFFTSEEKKDLISPRYGKPALTHLRPLDSFIVVDCGSGSCHGTVQQISVEGNGVQEICRPLAGPRGDLSVDLAFEILLCELFTAKFIKEFQNRYPVAWLDLMRNFGQRKRGLHPFKLSPMNLPLPVSFVEFFRKTKKTKIEAAVRKLKNPEIHWTSQGMLRIGPGTLSKLFQPTVNWIMEFAESLVNSLPVLAAPSLKALFLVGGFANSQYLQHAVKKSFNHRYQIVIPEDPGLIPVKGAALFGALPSNVGVRRSHFSFGIGILHKFDPENHPREKQIRKGGAVWCRDIFDVLLAKDQPLELGEIVRRRYRPASTAQTEILLQIYSTEAASLPHFVTDAGVKKCGTLRLEVSREDGEIELQLTFWQNEIKAAAFNVATKQSVRTEIFFP